MAKLPKPGELIAGKYVVAEVLGRGAMGIVVAATHRELQRQVAIKFMLATERDGEQARARFVREARAVASLESEHIVQLLDFGALADGALYMVMPRLSGQDLLRELKSAGGTLATRDAVDFVIQACLGLAEAHARGIVHRDIKPSNLFVTRRASGEPLLKILDFGISKADESPGELSLTASSSLLGSPLYMSPEQIRQAKSVDHRTDIWSLGVVLYHLLAGKSPFEDVSASAVVAAIAADEPVPLEERGLGVAPKLSQIVARCLQKAPAFRQQSVVELARELAPFGSRRARLWLAELEARTEPAPPSSASVLAAATFDDRAPISAGQDTAAPSVVERSSAAKSRSASKPSRVIFPLLLVAAIVSGLLVLTRPERQSPATAPASAAAATPSASASTAANATPVAAPIATPAPVLPPAEPVLAPASPKRNPISKPSRPKQTPPRALDPLDDHT